MPAAAARYFLTLTFDRSDLDRIYELAAKNQDGTLTPSEQEELREYRHAGFQLDLLRAKAALALRRHETNGAP